MLSKNSWTKKATPKECGDSNKGLPRNLRTRQLIKHAEESGFLPPGGTIVESSSGNFGIGLAMIGAARGYKVMIVVDAKTPPTMQALLKAYGAELIFVPLSEADDNGSMQVARMKRAKQLAVEIPGAWYPCQHLNPLNPTAHSEYTAQEIENAFYGAPAAIVIGISTAGQLAGIGRYFRKNYPSTRIVGVDIAGSAILGTRRHPYLATGVGLSFVPPSFDPDLIDSAYSIPDDLAFSVCRALARKEGLLLGTSTGAIMAAALADTLRFGSSGPVVAINPDRGDRYLETVYNDDWLAAKSISLLSDEELEAAYRAIEPVPFELIRKAGANS